METAIPQKRIRIDCHCHTGASFDCRLTPEQFVFDAVTAGLDAAIICDHNTFAGVEAVQALSPPFRVIRGREISTRDGELLGLFLTSPVPAGKSARETIESIHAQGGLAVVPHPFAWTALHRLRREKLIDATPYVDAVEGANARNEIARADYRAQRLAVRFAKPITAGSDAHERRRVGSGYLEMEPFADAADFLAKLPGARPVIVRRMNFFNNMFGFLVSYGEYLYTQRKLPLPPESS